MTDAYSRWVSQSYEDWMNDMATDVTDPPPLSGNARQRRKLRRAWRCGYAVKGIR